MTVKIRYYMRYDMGVIYGNKAVINVYCYGDIDRIGRYVFD